VGEQELARWCHENVLVWLPAVFASRQMQVDSWVWGDNPHKEWCYPQ